MCLAGNLGRPGRRKQVVRDDGQQVRKSVHTHLGEGSGRRGTAAGSSPEGGQVIGKSLDDPGGALVTRSASARP